MQKRHNARQANGGSGNLLPLTDSDVGKTKKITYGGAKNRRKNKGLTGLYSLLSYCFVFAFVVYIAFEAGVRSGKIDDETKERIKSRVQKMVPKDIHKYVPKDMKMPWKRRATDSEPDSSLEVIPQGEGGEEAEALADGVFNVAYSQVLPLSQFETLAYPLKHAKLVGIFFGASWCPVCAPVSKKLDEMFGESLLPAPGPEVVPPAERVDFSIVYVSSDINESQMLGYQKLNWISVPFDSDERTSLKRNFQACAQKEMIPLGIDRKFEIPTLIIIDAETHAVVTTEGVADLDQHGMDAVGHWMELNNVMRSLEDKYD